MLVPGSTMNASLLVLVLGAFGKLSLKKGSAPTLREPGGEQR